MKVGHLRSFRTQMRRNPPPVPRRRGALLTVQLNNLHILNPSASLNVSRYTYAISDLIPDLLTR
jgi:hypothetical protein